MENALLKNRLWFLRRVLKNRNRKPENKAINRENARAIIRDIRKIQSGELARLIRVQSERAQKIAAFKTL